MFSLIVLPIINVVAQESNFSLFDYGEKHNMSLITAINATRNHSPGFILDAFLVYDVIEYEFNPKAEAILCPEGGCLFSIKDATILATHSMSDKRYSLVGDLEIESHDRQDGMRIFPILMSIELNNPQLWQGEIMYDINGTTLLQDGRGSFNIPYSFRYDIGRFIATEEYAVLKYLE